MKSMSSYFFYDPFSEGPNSFAGAVIVPLQDVGFN
jgi:hypothetical protein